MGLPRALRSLQAGCPERVRAAVGASGRSPWRVPVVTAVALWSCVGTLAFAGEVTIAAASASAPAPAASAVAPQALRKGMQDPMDRLRERLALKLGGAPVEPGNPGVLRVVNRSGAPGPASNGSASMGSGLARTAATPARDGTAAPRAAGAAAHWDYTGWGRPDRWATLSPEFATCARGSRQSPIDIRDGIKVELEPVAFDYRASGFRVIDNGHTVQVDVDRGNAIEVMGRRYELQQFHFHRPSEERIDGRQYDMVVHLLHKASDGRLAVVAVLLQAGNAHPLVQAVWNNLPLEKGEPVTARASLELASLLPEDRGYYTYMGSLTTPPCSEGVLWMVMRQPVAVSAEQIGIFARLYPMNARPLQRAGGRLIKASN